MTRALAWALPLLGALSAGCHGGAPASPAGPSSSAAVASSGAAPGPSSSSIARPTTEEPLCALDPQGWCPAPAGDPCGEHGDVASCRADARCGGIVYRGESVIACRLDERDFGVNCPTVGCRSLEGPLSEPRP